MNESWRRWALVMVATASLGAFTAKPARADECFAAVKASDYDRAVSECTRMVKSGQLSQNSLAITLVNRGAAYHRKDQYEAAIRDYDRAIRLYPSYARAYYGRGLVYLDKEDHPRVERDFDEAVRLNPDLRESVRSALTFAAYKKRLLAELDDELDDEPEKPTKQRKDVQQRRPNGETRR